MTTNPSERPEWRALETHAASLASTHLRDLFAGDADRGRRLCVELPGLLFDYSKHVMTDDTRQLLLELAKACGVEARRDAMFRGDAINVTEGRSVLHAALRGGAQAGLEVDGEDVDALVRGELEKVAALSEQIGAGELRGFTGEPLTDIVNIGIGGSDLGPVMVTEALRAYRRPGIRTYFVSNIDGADLEKVLASVRAETTLFLVASKSFGTDETLTNARSARSWLWERLGVDAQSGAVAKHFYALSANPERVREFGIAEANRLTFWDWVGGRYSLWSAIGTSIACAVGMENFESLLAGAREVDEHFREAPLAENIPVWMALLGVWHANFRGSASHAVLPYHQDLHRFPAYLQQADMESNGKRTRRGGEPVEGYDTGPVVWGEPGTNGQHAFYQLIHQGTRVVPADFLLFARAAHERQVHHDKLIANGIAQTEALMRGRTLAEAEEELRASGLAEAEVQKLAAHKTFPGNRSTSTFFADVLDPRTLGMLIALYEHKIFVQGVIWDVNSFDQMGVELGKHLATQIYSEIRGEGEHAHDSSTSHLVRRYRDRRGG